MLYKLEQLFLLPDLYISLKIIDRLLLNNKSYIYHNTKVHTISLHFVENNDTRNINTILYSEYQIKQGVRKNDQQETTIIKLPT